MSSLFSFFQPQEKHNVPSKFSEIAGVLPGRAAATLRPEHNLCHCLGRSRYDNSHQRLENGKHALYTTKRYAQICAILVWQVTHLSESSPTALGTHCSAEEAIVTGTQLLIFYKISYLMKSSREASSGQTTQNVIPVQQHKLS